jgi:hypothetical protein
VSIYFIAIWNILQALGYFMTIWHILCSFGTFFPVWVSRAKKSGNPALGPPMTYLKISPQKLLPEARPGVQLDEPRAAERGRPLPLEGLVQVPISSISTADEKLSDKFYLRTIYIWAKF